MLRSLGPCRRNAVFRFCSEINVPHRSSRLPPFGPCPTTPGYACQTLSGQHVRARHDSSFSFFHPPTTFARVPLDRSSRLNPASLVRCLARYTDAPLVRMQHLRGARSSHNRHRNRLATIQVRASHIQMDTSQLRFVLYFVFTMECVSTFYFIIKRSTSLSPGNTLIF